jgi:predicted RNA-binding protein YlxR (DUF448 family)
MCAFAIRRKCVSCGEIYNRDTLLRVLKDYKSKDLIINPDKNVFGRSVYFCKTRACVSALAKNKKYKNTLDLSGIETHLKNNDSNWKD